MNRLGLILVFLVPSFALAQSIAPSAARPAFGMMSIAPADVPKLSAESDPGLDLSTQVFIPRMSAELALDTYRRQANRQSQALAGYSASTLIRAELPTSSQRGEFRLERHYIAPRTLAFKAVRYEGDGFVKTNVIARILQSEVDHVQKDDPSLTALAPENYKFSHKATTQLDGRTVHVYQIKPRKKRPGLFKGQIYLDAQTGRLVRVEGRVVRSPSIFIKKIDFVQDYAEVDGFNLPAHMHSEAKAALVGRTVVDIENRDYQPIPAAPVSARAGAD